MRFAVVLVLGKYEQMFGARYRAMIECSKTATSCDALEKCNESE